MREKGIEKKERGKGENGTLARKEEGGRSKRVLKREEGFKWQLEENGCMKEGMEEG